MRALTLPEKQELLWGDEQFDVPGGRERHTGTNHGIPRLGKVVRRARTFRPCGRSS